MERIVTQYTELSEIYPISSRKYYSKERITSTLSVTGDEIPIPINHIVDVIFLDAPVVPNNLVWYYEIEVCRGRRLPESRALALLMQAIETEEYLCFINKEEVYLEPRREQYTALVEHSEWSPYIALETEVIYDDVAYTATTRDIEPSAEEIAEFLANPSAAYLYSKKLGGIEFEGVMCSATKEDMWGLTSVVEFVRAGNPTRFKFDNGNTLLITQDNVDSFYAVWAPFRASFF